MERESAFYHSKGQRKAEHTHAYPALLGERAPWFARPIADDRGAEALHDGEFTVAGRN